MRRIPFQSDRRGPAGGFSLAELLFALAILGLALTSVVTLFPAAARQTENAAGHAVGDLICKNVLTVARFHLRHGQGSWVGSSLAAIPTGSSTGLMDPDAVQYPDGSSDTHGALLFGRQIDGENDYMLVAVSYLKDPNYSVSSEAITITAGNYDDETLTVSNADGDFVRIGSPLLAANGRFSYVKGKTVGATETTVTLTHALDRDSSTAISNDVLVVVGRDGGGTLLPDVMSPVLSAMSVRTALPLPE